MKQQIVRFSLRKDGTLPYLSEVLPQIPNNVILDKTLPGLGATSTEIFAQRNSILIEPNVPVIVGKSQSEQYKQATLLGIYKGITHQQIINYINSSKSKHQYLKVLCTPESFWKLIECSRLLQIDLRRDAFMLMDEAHKYCEDIGYRQTIIDPFDFFFECEQKAMVSATPVHQFSDPRFENFVHLKLIPTFDYSQDLRLITTTNVVHSVREYFAEMGNEVPIFIFANSLELIQALMRYLNVDRQSTIFSSTNGAELMKQNGFIRVFYICHETNMGMINWLTSRYYVAFDLELTVKPHVLILTDCYFAEQSMVNPTTDAVQIVGRFRNGVRSITHISNFDQRLQVRTQEELLQEIECDRRIYEDLGGNARHATSEIARNAFVAAQKNCRYCELLNPDGTLNHFKVDRRVEVGLKESAYHSPKKLLESYSNAPHFRVHYEYKQWKIGDKERISRTRLTTPKEVRRLEMMDNLDLLDDPTFGISKEILEEIKEEDPLLVEAYYKLGREVIEKKCLCNDALMREQLILIEYKTKVEGAETIKLIKNAFKENHWYSANELKTTIVRIFKELGINLPGGHRPTAKTICEFFDARPVRTAKEYGYYLSACKY